MEHTKRGAIVLADGAVFAGTSVAHEADVCGEVVFNTAQTGYQEILTDPSYADQIIVFTHPHIGNVGTNAMDMESDRVYAKGAIVRSFSDHEGHWRAEETFGQFLRRHHVVVISEVDTRALAQHLQKHGNQTGYLLGSGNVLPTEAAAAHAARLPGLTGKDLASQVSTKAPYAWQQRSWRAGPPSTAIVPATSQGTDYHVVVYDYGAKHSIMRCLVDRGCAVTVVPATFPVSRLLALSPNGIVLSNGPGDPAACTQAIAIIKQLLRSGLPLMGICLGHQLLALASGAKTVKMALGHHGANHPVQSLKDGSVLISSQNHGFVVSEHGLPSSLRITHRSLFDGSIAGIERIDVPAFGFQGHPEAGPGPYEMTGLFDQFVSLIEVSHAKAE